MAIDYISRLRRGRKGGSYRESDRNFDAGRTVR